MQIGSAWTKTEEKDGKKVVTGISPQLDNAILELYPELKNVRFSLKPIPAEQRTKDNSPHWRVTMYKPKEQTSSEGGSAITDEEIPF